jgi:hypothetical protein
MKTKRSAIAQKPIENWKLDRVTCHRDNSALNLSVRSSVSFKKPEQSWKSLKFRFNHNMNEMQLPVTNRMM